MPTISVLMSVYNGEKFVKDAIDSVLNQTFKDFEFIIFDDCSTDNSVQIIESYQDDRIVFIKNHQNRGLTVNLHEGMNLAKGKYLARMDADDICMSHRFQKQLDFLESHPEISILGSAVVFFDDSGKEILGTQPLTHDEIIIELLLGFTMLHPSVMMRLADMRKYHLNYDTHFRYSQDFDLWVRSSKFLKLANLVNPLLKMREHQFKISRALKPAQKAFSDEIRDRQLKELGVTLSTEEIDVFNSAASGVLNNQKKFITILDNILVSIIHKNSLYNSDLLKTNAANHFRHVCREKLLKRNNDGLKYWKSKMKRYDILSFRTFLGLCYHSIRTIISI